jgi:extradiol dioxygenase family protein
MLATLHTVTLVTDGPTLADRLRARGFSPIRFSSNYPASDSVESSLWSVPAPVVASVVHFKSPDPVSANVRVLKMALAAGSRSADSTVEAAFFKNVLGTEVPRWPAGVERTEKVRVQVWTYLIPDVVAANKRLRESGIPVVYDPVAITTAYLGDHKTMAIRSPDGTIVELVEAAAQ